jgi:hypothetical protein
MSRTHKRVLRLALAAPLFAAAGAIAAAGADAAAGAVAAAGANAAAGAVAAPMLEKLIAAIFLRLIK